MSRRPEHWPLRLYTTATRLDRLLGLRPQEAQAPFLLNTWPHTFRTEGAFPRCSSSSDSPPHHHPGQSGPRASPAASSISSPWPSSPYLPRMDHNSGNPPVCETTRTLTARPTRPPARLLCRAKEAASAAKASSDGICDVGLSCSICIGMERRLCGRCRGSG